jgi:hypothetical protein
VINTDHGYKCKVRDMLILMTLLELKLYLSSFRVLSVCVLDIESLIILLIIEYLIRLLIIESLKLLVLVSQKC